MGNRIIKESIRTSRTVNAMSDFEFRLWTYLITYVDDYGRGSADAELLKGFVFPRRRGVTEEDIERAMRRLEEVGGVRLYEAQGERYFCFPNWSAHQRIQTKRSKFPPPPGESEPETAPPDAQAAVWRCCEEAFGAPGRAVQSEVRAFLNGGMQPQLVCAAVRDAAAHGARSWAYARAILQRCRQEGIFTQEAYTARGRAPAAARDNPFWEEET